MIIWDGDILDRTDRVSTRYLCINNCGMQRVTSDHTCLRRHGRSDYHILLITDGSGVALYRGREYPLHRGSYVLYPPHEEQRYTLNQNTSSFYCHFSGTAVPEILEEGRLSGGVHHGTNTKSAEGIFSEMIRRHFKTPPSGSENASLVDLFYALSEGIEGMTRSEDDPLFSVLAYLHENYKKPITLDEIALQGGYSKSRFSRIFSAATGKSPIRYLKDIRLAASCEMLGATALPIAVIAAECGFADPLYYSRAFRAAYGMAPSAYRIQCQGR